MGMTKRFELPPIPESERTPRVQGLLGIIGGLTQEVQRQEERIGQLEEENAILKGEKKRPRFKPSKLDETTGEEDSEGVIPTRGAARVQKSGGRPPSSPFMRSVGLHRRRSPPGRDSRVTRTTWCRIS
jgi:hypothetical protein